MDRQPTLLDKIKESGAWITLVTAGFLLLFLFVNYVQEQKQQELLDKQTSNTATIIEQVKTITEQNKRLAEDNKRLSEQSNRYAYCNAVLLAKYTQTGAAIEIEDLENCVLKTFPGNPNILNPQPAPQQSLNNNQGSGNSQSRQAQPVNNTPTQPSQPTAPSTQPQAPQPQPQNPNLNIAPTPLTPGIKLDVPCISVPLLLRVC